MSLLPNVSIDDVRRRVGPAIKGARPSPSNAAPLGHRAQPATPGRVGTPDAVGPPPQGLPPHPSFAGAGDKPGVGGSGASATPTGIGGDDELTIPTAPPASAQATLGFGVGGGCCPPTRVRYVNTLGYVDGQCSLTSQELVSFAKAGRGTLEHFVPSVPPAPILIGPQGPSPVFSLLVSRALSAASLHLALFECVHMYVRADLTQTTTYVGAGLRYGFGTQGNDHGQRDALQALAKAWHPMAKQLNSALGDASKANDLWKMKSLLLQWVQDQPDSPCKGVVDVASSAWLDCWLALVAGPLAHRADCPLVIDAGAHASDGTPKLAYTKAPAGLPAVDNSGFERAFESNTPAGRLLASLAVDPVRSLMGLSTVELVAWSIWAAPGGWFSSLPLTLASAFHVDQPSIFNEMRRSVPFDLWRFKETEKLDNYTYPPLTQTQLDGWFANSYLTTKPTFASILAKVQPTFVTSGGDVAGQQLLHDQLAKTTALMATLGSGHAFVSAATLAYSRFRHIAALAMAIGAPYDKAGVHATLQNWAVFEARMQDTSQAYSALALHTFPVWHERCRWAHWVLANL